MSDVSETSAPPGTRWWVHGLWVVALVSFMVVRVLTADRGQPDLNKEPHYAWLYHQAPGVPVAFDSCRTIEVEVNLDQAPHDAMELVEESVERVKDFTGLNLVLAGTTTMTADQHPRSGGNTILVVWLDEDHADTVRDARGRARPYLAGPPGSVRFVGGLIMLNADYYRRLRWDFGDDNGRSTVMHEFGHVLGLGHVNEPNEIMNRSGSQVRDFGPGDREGLRQLGQGPCFD